jgi:hypothetical protein
VRVGLLFLVAATAACSFHSQIPAADGGDDSAPAATPDGGSAAADAGADSAKAPDGGSAAICTGGYSAQLDMPYDDACDNFYLSGPGGNPCANNNDCAALNGKDGVFCCYVPPSGSACDRDYHGTPQCVPK